MAITVTDLRTTITDANSTTGWSGSNGVALFTAQPTPVFSTGCIGVQVSNATEDAYYTGTARDLSGGVLVYVWVFLRGEMDTTAGGGAQILLGDGTNRIGFHVAGSDLAGFRHDQGPVGWQCLVLDTGNLPTDRTVLAGSFAGLNLASITQFGAVFKTLVKSVGGTENCFVDVIRIGNDGIRITGGTSADPSTFGELAARDRSNAAALGICRELGAGSFGVQGSLTFGTTGWFATTDTSVAFEDRSTIVDRYALTVEGDAAFRLGEKVGSGDTATGAAGVSITVPAGVGATFSADTATDFLVYGSTLTGFTGGVALPTALSGVEFIGSTVAASGRIDPGATVLRDASVTGSTDTGGALDWVAATDLAYSTVTNNPVGILHLAAGTFAYTDLEFSGNTFDVRNDSGGLVTLNISGGDSPSVDNVGAASTDVVNVVNFSLTGLVDNSEVRIYRASDDVELFGVENSSGGTVTYQYNFTGSTPVYIHIHNVAYVFVRLELTLGGSDRSVPIQQRFDRTYSNPT